jgi:hypothetical protein
LLTLVVILLAAPAHPVPIIDTRPPAGGIGYFGDVDATTPTWAFGQTFTPTAPETVLDSFSFVVGAAIVDPPQFNPVAFRGYVYGWDGVKAFGPALHESSTVTTTGASAEYEEFTFPTGGTPLIAGQQYIAFVGAVDDGLPEYGALAFAGADVYPGGALFYTAGPVDSPWTIDPNFTGQDLTFVSTFSAPAQPAPVPEPGTLALLGLGLSGLGLRRRRAR